MEKITWRCNFISTRAMTTTAIVTGAAGFIGSALVEHLLSRGYYVIGIDNFRTGKRENLAEAQTNKQFQLLDTDISKVDLSKEVTNTLSSSKLIPKEIDMVFHLAAISSVRESIENPILVNNTNVSGTVNLLEMARKLDVKRFVFSSSAAVYGNPKMIPVDEDTPCHPLSPYAASKIAGEFYIHSFDDLYGIGGTILRYFNVYGPRQAYSEYSGVISIFANQAINNEPITIEGNGGQTRSFLYVEDVARATLAAGKAERIGEMTINLSGTDSISISRVAQIIMENVEGSQSKVINVPPRLGDVQDSIGSMERAHKILQFYPEVQFEEGLLKTVEWYRSHQPSKRL
jgi:UDP-glucose 4-epimerase